MDGKANQVEGGLEDQSIAAQDLALGLVVQNAITMQDVTQRQGSSVKTTAEAIQALKIGNGRFFSGHQTPNGFSALERRAQILT